MSFFRSSETGKKVIGLCVVFLPVRKLGKKSGLYVVFFAVRKTGQKVIGLYVVFYAVRKLGKKS